MSVMGPIFGVTMGALALMWLQANAGTDRDANVEVICTLAMPYLVFYLAETAFGEEYQMSGVLSVVCFGLTFASPFGKVRIDPDADSSRFCFTDGCMRRSFYPVYPRLVRNPPRAHDAT